MRAEAGISGGVPPQSAAKRKVEGTGRLLRSAALRLQQLHALHTGACAAARRDYLAAGSNGALLASVAQGLDSIYSSLASHTLMPPAHVTPCADDEHAEPDEGDDRSTLVSWKAVKAADSALTQLRDFCSKAHLQSASDSSTTPAVEQARSNDVAAATDSVSRGIAQWLKEVEEEVWAVQHGGFDAEGGGASVSGAPGALEKAQATVSVEFVQATSAQAQEHLRKAGEEALAVTRQLREALVADRAEENVETEEDDGELEEVGGRMVVARHEEVTALLAWERLQSLSGHFAAAQKLLACLSDAAGCDATSASASASAGVTGAKAKGSAAKKGSSATDPAAAAAFLARQVLAEQTEELCRVGAVVGMLGWLGEEVVVRADRFHRACCKLAMVLLGLLSEMIENGFCRAPDEAEEGDEIEGVEGMGMGEGEGEKNVSDQIEDEEQMTGAEQEGQEKKEEGSKQKREEGEEAVEMEQDFDGELDDVDKEKEEEEEEEEEEGDDKEEVDREMGDVGSDEEQVLDERHGDDDLDEDEDKQDDKYEKDNPLKVISMWWRLMHMLCCSLWCSVHACIDPGCVRLGMFRLVQ
jgi:hypothetical protein